MYLETLENMCLDIYGLDLVYIVSASRLAWQACLKKTEVKLQLLIDYDMTVCSCHVTYAFQSESRLYSSLNVKELLARSRREI